MPGQSSRKRRSRKARSRRGIERESESKTDEKAEETAPAEEAPATPERVVDGGQTEVEQLRAEAEKARDQYLRARADMENLRKRVTREREQLADRTLRGFIEALVPTLDSLDHALAALDADHDTEQLAEGIQAIHQQLEKALEAQGVEKVTPALGETFDPERHEALAVEKTDEKPANTIVDVLQSGYVVRGVLVRAARVRIAQSP